MSLHLHGLSGTPHSMGLRGFLVLSFILWPKFVHSSGYCPSHQVFCLQGAVGLSCLMGTCLGFGGSFCVSFSSILQALQGGCSSTGWGDEKLQDCLCIFIFLSFWGDNIAVLSCGNCMPLFLRGFPTLFNPIMHPTSTKAGGGCFAFSPCGFEM